MSESASIPQEVRILVLGGLIVGLVVLRNLFAGGSGILGAWVYGKASAAIRAGLAARLTEVGFPFFTDQPPGRLLNVLATESWRAADAIATGLAILTNLTAALILFVFLWLLSWRLTLAVAVGLCLVQLAQAAAVRPLQRMSRGLTMATWPCSCFT
jgi:ABC-type multidrug transport system fused ATPase/permease subunit